MRTIFLLLVTFFIAVSCIPAETSPLSDELDELKKTGKPVVAVVIACGSALAIL